jgi:hypothetical protein
MAKPFFLSPSGALEDSDIIVNGLHGFGTFVPQMRNTLLLHVIPTKTMTAMRYKGEE